MAQAQKQVHDMVKQPPAFFDATVDDAEIAKFTAMAEEWWNPNGKFKPLHKFNPVRLEYIRDRLCENFGKDPKAARPLEGLRILDIGSGGGLLSEPLCRMGATIIGIDASERSVQIAKAHAQAQDLHVDYRFTTAENLVKASEKFDAVMNMEVIEHVADVGAFIRTCTALVKPGGLMFMATLNRTAKSYILAIVGAEYVMGWLPRGTHDWQKFLKPSEIATHLRQAGMQISELTGVVYSPFKDVWKLSKNDLAVNYMLLAQK